ncbi:MAG TPA: MFS transporter [Sedimentisphaerales bacterium]|nr:MFS transporter [Sedimentisphaerales bacterium]
MHVYGITRDKAATLLSMIAWGMVFGGPALGVLSQRLLKSRRKTLILCMSALTILLLAPTLLPAGLPRGILLTWFFLFSVCSSAVVVVAFTTAKELFPLEIAGTSIGIVNFFPFFGGAVYQPVLGAILDVYGKTSADQYPVAAYQMVMLVLLLSSLAALVCSIFLKDTYPK